LAHNGAAQVAVMPNFEKRNYNYSEWTKGRFSEVVTVSGPGRMIFLAGVGAEDENAPIGTILYPGDVLGQCRYAFDKIKRTLARHGATFADIVKIVTYVTDIRSAGDYFKCLTEALGDAPRPAHTFLNINQLAHPGMLVEIDVTAIVNREPL
jgi:2-iminobutanoate/2-iminopropanoate deaminase